MIMLCGKRIEKPNVTLPHQNAQSLKTNRSCRMCRHPSEKRGAEKGGQKKGGSVQKLDKKQRSHSRKLTHRITAPPRAAFDAPRHPPQFFHLTGSVSSAMAKARPHPHPVPHPC